MAMLRLADPECLLWYEDLPGEDPPLVQIHGLGAAGSNLASVARHPRLAHRRAILLDLPGHGFSEAVADFAYRPEDNARVVAALLDHCGVSGAAVIAHSAGGPVAVWLATLRPDLVSRLILAEGNLDPALAGGSRMIAAMSEEEYVAVGHAALLTRARAAALSGDAMMAYVFGSMHVADSRAIHRSATGMLAETRPSLWDRFVGLAIPRAYLYGEWTLQQAQHAEAAEALRGQGVMVLTVPGAGHALGLDNLDGLAAAITAALQFE